MECLLLEQDRQGKIQISKIGGEKQLFLNANLRLAIDQTIYFFMRIFFHLSFHLIHLHNDAFYSQTTNFPSRWAS